jgi:hypothetical protein
LQQNSWAYKEQAEGCKEGLPIGPFNEGAQEKLGLKRGIPGVELCKPFGILIDGEGGGVPARILSVQKPTVPDSIQVPASEELILMARATGFQIYVCRPNADGKPAWTLKAPDAELFDEQGKPIGKHFGGPTWQLNDGSQITGKLAAKADAPDPKAIPWLLLTVTGHSGNGKLSGVTSIQRVNTVGGLAPAAQECSAQSGEVEFKSSYSADYYFYVRR